MKKKHGHHHHHHHLINFVLSQFSRYEFDVNLIGEAHEWNQKQGIFFFFFFGFPASLFKVLKYIYISFFKNTLLSSSEQYISLIILLYDTTLQNKKEAYLTIVTYTTN